MRVLLLNQFYLPDVAATGQLLGDLTEELHRRGHEVHVLSSQRPYAGGREEFPPEQIIGGARVHRLAATGFGRVGFVGRIFDYLSFYLLAVRRAMSLPRMDACVALSTPPFIALIGVLLKRRRKTKLICWTMDLYPDIAVTLGLLREGGLMHRALAGVARRIYTAADAVIALGEVMGSKLRRAGTEPEKITVVHNWVPGEAVQFREPQQREAVTLLYSGNLGMGHELDTAVHAAALLPDRSNLRLRFVGHGKMRKKLERLVAELALERVEFAPPCPLCELSVNLADGDIHLISQRPGTEGLIVPSKVYGILAAGRAVLYIGPEETEVAQIIKQSHAGRVVPPGDIDRTGEALRELMNDGDLRRAMGRRGREYYEDHFTRQRGVVQIADVIESAFGRAAVQKK